MPANRIVLQIIFQLKIILINLLTKRALIKLIRMKMAWNKKVHLMKWILKLGYLAGYAFHNHLI